MLANSEDPDQTPRSAASDLGLHCLPLSQKWDARLYGLKVIYKGCFKFFFALYADRICSDQHFVENCIEKFPSV